jgi:predicted aspartyl protease
MPHSKVTIGSDGPAIDLAVSVGRTWAARLVAQGVSVPSPVTVRSLIDTGADISAVHPRILQQLGCRPTAAVRIRRPGMTRNFLVASLYDAEVAIDGTTRGSQWISMTVIGVAPSTPTVLALIGRDALVQCTFFYNGPRSELTLSC